MNKIKTLLVLGLISLINTNFLFSQDPLFPNSVVSNDIDFILETDLDSYTGLRFKGLENKEMPGDPNGGDLFDVNTYVFDAEFSDGEVIEIWCHSSFENEIAAQEYVTKLGPRLGKLPDFQRNMIDHVVIHKGDRTAFAEIEGQFFILYSQNMDKRISTNDLEETVFHESVHASYQFMYQDHPDWTSAQSADPTFVTEYAQDNPRLEDIAESALFSYAYLVHPGRLESDVESWLEQNIPNRIEFFRAFYSEMTNVDDLVEVKKLIISPSSDNSKFIIQGLDGAQGKVITVLDMHGKIIQSLKYNHQERIQLDLSHYNNGLYIVSIPGYEASKILKFN